MTRLLVIAHHFPPIGGGGVQRSVKFLKHLPSFGIEPVVFTGPGRTSGRWEPEDQSLLAELGEGLDVRRMSASPPTTRGRLDRWLGRGGPFASWMDAGLRELAAELETPPDAIYVSLAPYDALAPALQLARRWKRPLIADLRDPWALDEVRVYPTRWHRGRELRAMRRMLRECDAVIWNCPEALRAGRELLGKDVEPKQHCITNGYDEADFAGLQPRAPDGRFRIVHSGYLHTALGERHRDRSLLARALGGELHRIDFLTRSHVYLLRALERLQEDAPELTQHVDLHLHGVADERDQAIVEQSSFERVHVHGYTPHDEVVRALVECDLLFLPMHDLPKGERARIVPGKTYEYLRAGAPILAAIPEGDAREFVHAAKAGLCVAPSDVEGIASALRRFLAPPAQQPKKPFESRPEPGPKVTRFERRALTAELAQIISELGGPSPAS
jgi:glycosyltransferase involved in cell wall biosynthesis